MNANAAARKTGDSPLLKLLSLAAFLISLFAHSLHAQGLSGPDEGWSFPANLNSWTFWDTNNWHSDLDYGPISFTNLSSSSMGNIEGGYSLWLDSPDPAWLRYNLQEGDGTTNLLIEYGSVVFSFAPNWGSATTNQNGSGPGNWGRLLEVGSYSTNATGWWSLFLDPGGTNIYFGAQTNSGDDTLVTYLTAPIDWATNVWHQIALTYSSTSTALYLDGELVTNGVGISVFPGPEVQTNGFSIGSDATGTVQAHGMFDDIYTYDFQLSTNDIGLLYWYFGLYAINVANVQARISPGPSSPSVDPVFKAVTGQGWLQSAGPASSCVTSSNVWLTNLTCAFAVFGTNLAENCTFAIEGGTPGVPYDVFATAALSPSDPNYGWAWLGQGYTCTNYTMTNLPPTGAFLILGTPQDSDIDGLTDAYEKLISHSDPNMPDTSGDGMLDGWKVLWGMNTLLNNPNQPNLRKNYTYDASSWLQVVSGIWSESITLDDEGNVKQLP